MNKSKHERYETSIKIASEYISNNLSEASIIPLLELKEFINKNSVYKFSNAEIARIISFAGNINCQIFKNHTQGTTKYVFIKNGGKNGKNADGL